MKVTAYSYGVGPSTLIRSSMESTSWSGPSSLPRCFLWTTCFCCPLTDQQESCSYPTSSSSDTHDVRSKSLQDVFLSTARRQYEPDTRTSYGNGAERGYLWTLPYYGYLSVSYDHQVFCGAGGGRSPLNFLPSCRRLPKLLIGTLACQYYPTWSTLYET